MRRIVVALASTVTALVLLFSYHTSVNRTGTVAVAAAGTSSSSSTATTRGPAPGSAAPAPTGPAATATAPETVTGQSVQTPYGPVQVRITVVDGSITAASAIAYPSGNGRDQIINSRAVPVLEDETLQAQSAHVDVVSGATFTSQGYARSLQSAIDGANL